MRLVLLFLLLFGPLEARGALPREGLRQQIYLDSGWKFFKAEVGGAEGVGFDDAHWADVALPHTWNSQDGQDGGNNYYRGVSWYRQWVEVPAWQDREIYLQFDGANSVAQVWVNGKYMGEHRGGNALFRFDVTLYLGSGRNLIAVRVDNAYRDDLAPLNADYTFFGGLYRRVSLLATDKLQINPMDFGSPGVYLKQSKVSAECAELEVSTKLYNHYAQAKSLTVVTSLFDAEGILVGQLTSPHTLVAQSGLEVVQQTLIAKPHLWNGTADPYLYKVSVELQQSGISTDAVVQPLGFRFFRVDPEKGFFLNGKPYDLHGVNRHQDRQDKGWAISQADQDQDFLLLKELGVTAIRLAHYQQDNYFYSLMDQAGIVVWTEIPLISRISSSADFAANVKQQLLELIRQNHNHPSIVFWGIANEITQQLGPNPLALLKSLNATAHLEDPNRLTTLAFFCCTRLSHPANFVTDVVGHNQYKGWYVDSYNNIGGWLDSFHSRFRNRPLALSEYGAGGSIFQHAEASTVPEAGGKFHPEEYQTLFHEAYWQALKRPFVWGKFVWNMFDFASDGRNEGDSAGRNDKGLVSYDRKTKKDAFYFYKAQWSSEPVLYVTSRRWTVRTSPTTTIKVYANTLGVELKLNGKSLGEKTSDNRVFIWANVRLAEGQNTLEASGTRGGQIYRDQVIWNLVR